jgi:hypothetical protein
MFLCSMDAKSIFIFSTRIPEMPLEDLLLDTSLLSSTVLGTTYSMESMHRRLAEHMTRPNLNAASKRKLYLLAADLGDRIRSSAKMLFVLGKGLDRLVLLARRGLAAGDADEIHLEIGMVKDVEREAERLLARLKGPAAEAVEWAMAAFGEFAVLREENFGDPMDVDEDPVGAPVGDPSWGWAGSKEVFVGRA